MAARDAFNVSTRAELYTFTLTDDQLITALGVSTIADAPSELWYWEASSTATDDGLNIIKPTSIIMGNPGRFLRLIVESDWSAISNKPSFPTVATTGDYNDLSNLPSIPPSQVNSDWTSGGGLSQIVNKPSLSTVATSGSYNDLSNQPSIPSAQIQSDWTQSSSGSIDYIKNKPVTTITNGVSRSFNSSFQVSTTKLSQVNYSVNISANLSLSGGQIGTVFLESSVNGSSWTEVGRVSNGNTGSLTLGLNTTQALGLQLAGFIAANDFVRLRTTGTATITYIVGQEVTF